ncbi:hypothetical protein TGVEG_207230 [Toxoplasma gondii VEG]|uniref:Uncharacterized protein n=2 Tax=Toxoplasma gondii (strain ATCC 50861 / VEG) TaxID=432359 RepID=V4Z2T1_TOXGV|nr:hypothetical protein TGVEG_207230 [Toxoplasma gondii VEG]
MSRTGDEASVSRRSVRERMPHRLHAAGSADAGETASDTALFFDSLRNGHLSTEATSLSLSQMTYRKKGNVAECLQRSKRRTRQVETACSTQCQNLRECGDDWYAPTEYATERRGRKCDSRLPESVEGTETNVLNAKSCCRLKWRRACRDGKKQEGELANQEPPVYPFPRHDFAVLSHRTAFVNGSNECTLASLNTPTPSALLCRGTQRRLMASVGTRECLTHWRGTGIDTTKACRGDARKPTDAAPYTVEQSMSTTPEAAGRAAEMLTRQRPYSLFRPLARGKTDQQARISMRVSQKKPFSRCTAPPKPSTLVSAANPAPRLPLRSHCLTEQGSQFQLSSAVDRMMHSHHGLARETVIASDEEDSNSDGEPTQAQTHLSNKRRCEREDQEALAGPLGTDLLDNVEGQMSLAGNREQDPGRAEAVDSVSEGASTRRLLNGGMQTRLLVSESLSPSSCQQQQRRQSENESAGREINQEADRLKAKAMRTTSPDSCRRQLKTLRLVPLRNDRPPAPGVRPQTLVGPCQAANSSENEEKSAFWGRSSLMDSAQRTVAARVALRLPTGAARTHETDENSQQHEPVNACNEELKPDDTVSVNSGKRGSEHLRSTLFEEVAPAHGSTLSCGLKGGNSSKGTVTAGPRASVDSITSYVDASSDTATRTSADSGLHDFLYAGFTSPHFMRLSAREDEENCCGGVMLSRQGHDCTKAPSLYQSTVTVDTVDPKGRRGRLASATTSEVAATSPGGAEGRHNATTSNPAACTASCFVTATNGEGSHSLSLRAPRERHRYHTTYSWPPRSAAADTPHVGETTSISQETSEESKAAIATSDHVTTLDKKVWSLNTSCFIPVAETSKRSATLARVKRASLAEGDKRSRCRMRQNGSHHFRRCISAVRSAAALEIRQLRKFLQEVWTSAKQTDERANLDSCFPPGTENNDLQLLGESFQEAFEDEDIQARFNQSRNRVAGNGCDDPLCGYLPLRALAKLLYSRVRNSMTCAVDISRRSQQSLFASRLRRSESSTMGHSVSVESALSLGSAGVASQDTEIDATAGPTLDSSEAASTHTRFRPPASTDVRRGSWPRNPAAESHPSFGRWCRRFLLMHVKSTKIIHEGAVVFGSLANIFYVVRGRTVPDDIRVQCILAPRSWRHIRQSAEDHAGEPSGGRRAEALVLDKGTQMVVQDSSRQLKNGFAGEKKKSHWSTEPVVLAIVKPRALRMQEEDPAWGNTGGSGWSALKRGRRRLLLHAGVIRVK